MVDYEDVSELDVVAAINSLVLSYTLSVLYLNGVKSGDYQATFSGISCIITIITVARA